MQLFQRCRKEHYIVNFMDIFWLAEPLTQTLGLRIGLRQLEQALILIKVNGYCCITNYWTSPLTSYQTLLLDPRKVINFASLFLTWGWHQHLAICLWHRVVYNKRLFQVLLMTSSYSSLQTLFGLALRRLALQFYYVKVNSTKLFYRSQN